MFILKSFSFNRSGRAQLNRRHLAARHKASGGNGLGAFFHWLMPALSRQRTIGNALVHLGTLPLTAQSSLSLVRLHDETLLLGITPQNITLLTKTHGDPALPTATDELPIERRSSRP
jgi:flagellar biogenesis protein FliO